MSHGWRESRRAFGDAARWFVAVTGRVDGRWERPGLGEWDVRALVGHTSRSLLTVESYLRRPAESVQIQSAAEYYRATRSIATGPDVAERRAKMAASEHPWQPVSRERHVSRALRAYAAMATSADRGAVRDLSLIRRV